MQHDDYKRIAPWYDRLIDPFNKALRPIGFQFFRAGSGMRVLEIGCGTGTQLAFYRERGCRSAGIDLSAAMLQVARTRQNGAATVCRADAARLPFPNAAFDRVLASLVLHEMPPAVRPLVMAEMIRVLLPAGCLGITDYHPQPRRTLKGFGARWFIGLVERAAGRRHHRHFRHFMANGGIPRLARRMGLHLEDVKRVSGGNIGLYRLRRNA